VALGRGWESLWPSERPQAARWWHSMIASGVIVHLTEAMRQAGGRASACREAIRGRHVCIPSK